MTTEGTEIDNNPRSRSAKLRILEKTRNVLD
jgi:16S rRNA C1402 N4-methylase RsmH